MNGVPRLNKTPGLVIHESLVEHADALTDYVNTLADRLNRIEQRIQLLEITERRFYERVPALDKTHDLNQTIRTTASSGHMTTNSGHTRGKYGDAHAEWLTSLTPEEMSAYKRGRREVTLEHQKYIRKYLSCRNVLTKIASGETTNPAASARFILSTLGDHE